MIISERRYTQIGGTVLLSMMTSAFVWIVPIREGDSTTRGGTHTRFSALAANVGIPCVLAIVWVRLLRGVAGTFRDPSVCREKKRTMKMVLMGAGALILVVALAAGYVGMSTLSIKNSAAAFGEKFVRELAESWSVEALYARTTPAFGESHVRETIAREFATFQEELGTVEQLAVSAWQVHKDSKGLRMSMAFKADFERGRREVSLEMTRSPEGEWRIENLGIR